VKVANCKVILVLTYEYLPSKVIKTVPHPPYSRDIAPCDFYLYPQAKKEINGRRFETEIDAVKVLKAILKRLPKNGFQRVLEQWQWHFRGSIIECDKINYFL
jgi:histone-lysine N-methyltransferase SETMAR